MLLFLAFFNAIIDSYGLYPLVKIDGVNWPKSQMVKSVKTHKAFRVAQIKPKTVVLGTSRSAFGIDLENDAWRDAFKPRYNLSLAGADMYVTRRFLGHAQTISPLK